MSRVKFNTPKTLDSNDVNTNGVRKRPSGLANESNRRYVFILPAKVIRTGIYMIDWKDYDAAPEKRLW